MKGKLLILFFVYEAKFVGKIRGNTTIATTTTLNLYTRSCNTSIKINVNAQFNLKCRTIYKDFVAVFIFLPDLYLLSKWKIFLPHYI